MQWETQQDAVWRDHTPLGSANSKEGWTMQRKCMNCSDQKFKDKEKI